MGIFIVDFFCVSEKLVIEVDGDSHAREGAKEYDKVREEYLRSKGLRIIRFGNDAVRTNLDGVLTRLYEVIFNTSSP